MTHRQYLLWQAWVDEDLNRPDRHDYYLMQIACVFGGDKGSKPSDFKLKFVPVKQAVATGKPYDPNDPTTWVWTKESMAKADAALRKAQVEQFGPRLRK